MRDQGTGIETHRACAVFLLGLLLLLKNSASAAVGEKEPTDLRADSLIQPLGIDSPRPMLSWRLQDDTAGAKQTAYELFVYTQRPTAIETKLDEWDSGCVASSTSAGVAYGGPELQPEKRYFWRVKVWNKDGKPYLEGPKDPSRPPLIGSDSDREKTALNMSEMWTTFAKTGRASATGQPRWPAYTLPRRAAMMIDAQCKVEDDPFGQERVLWDSLSS